jgi:hypothetical protein
LKYGAGAGFMHLAQETSTMFLWHLTEMLIPYLEEKRQLNFLQHERAVVLIDGAYGILQPACGS